MKKFLIILGLGSMLNCAVFANGLLTNSNQSASYVRMICRLASLDIDGVYYNPAGLTKLLRDGFHASVSNQIIFQTRIVTNDLSIMNSKEHKGDMVAPIFPSIYGVYKKGDWAFSFGFNPVAGGGKVNFDKGIPMLEVKAAVLPTMLSAMGLPTDKYSLDMQFKGSSVYYGAQFNATYQISENFSAALGLRAVYASNAYEGYMRDIKINPTHPLANPNGAMISAPNFFTAIGQTQYAAATSDKEANVTQSGIGFAPVVGINFNYQKLNIGARYEFKTRMEIENDTKVDGTGMFPDKLKQRADVPAYFTIGISYKVLPQLNVAAGFGYFFDKQAKMHSWDYETNNYIRRENDIKSGVCEYSFGFEYNITEKVLLSTGYQYGKVGVTPQYQSDMSHTINNHTFGFGGQYKLNEKLKLNAGFLITKYVPYDVELPNPLNPTAKYTKTYDRTNCAFSVGLDISF
jgi:long-chain fatty acid transport protein